MRPPPCRQVVEVLRFDCTFNECNSISICIERPILSFRICPSCCIYRQASLFSVEMSCCFEPRKLNLQIQRQHITRCTCILFGWFNKCSLVACIEHYSHLCIIIDDKSNFHSFFQIHCIVYWNNMKLFLMHSLIFILSISGVKRFFNARVELFKTFNTSNLSK